MSISTNDGASSNPPQALRGQRHLPRLAVHSKCVEYLGRPPLTQTRCFRLDAHPSRGCRYSNTYPKSCLVASLRSQGNCHSRSFSLSLSDWHGPSRPGRPPNASHGWPKSVAIEYGAHARNPDARPSGSGTPTPLSGPVRGRGGLPRLSCSNLVSPRTSSCRSYGPPRGRHLEKGPSHGNSPLLRAVRVDGKTPCHPLPAPGVFHHQGYAAGVTRFGRSSDGCSAAHLLANELAASTSLGYGYKWERFVKFCGIPRCPLPASVKTIGYCLGHLYSEGRVTGTSIRPYLAAINTVHTRAGFPSPTNDPVIASIQMGYNRATADRVASIPRSVALPSALGALAVQMSLCYRRPTPVTAIAVGFLLALRPLSIQGILPEDVTTAPDAVFIRLRREKGNAGQRNDRVLRVPVKPAPDPASLLFSRLDRCPPGRVLSPFTTAWLNRALLSRQTAVRPTVGSVGQLIKIAMLRVKNALPFLEC
jgi:hypothetical protein